MMMVTALAVVAVLSQKQLANYLETLQLVEVLSVQQQVKIELFVGVIMETLALAVVIKINQALL